MHAGIAAMKLLDEAAFRHLDRLGEAVRGGIDQSFRRHGLPGATTGKGSLLKVHFTDRPVRDYRSALPRPEEAARLDGFFRALLDRGVLIAPNGLFALSTPMGDREVEHIVEACDSAIASVMVAPA